MPNGTLKAFPVVNAKLIATPSSQSSKAFTYPGTAPVVSANGTTNGIVWTQQNISPAVLHTPTMLTNRRQSELIQQQPGRQMADDQLRQPVDNKIHLRRSRYADGKVFVGTADDFVRSLACCPSLVAGTMFIACCRLHRREELTMANKVQGEGDYDAARRYNEETRKFVKGKQKAPMSPDERRADKAVDGLNACRKKRLMKAREERLTGQARCGRCCASSRPESAERAGKFRCSG